ncbi:MAG: hypothetical protein EHM47_03170 [Ignavibacteriales bacterium]|nr:MAG: hypothetical protein EHM47_03170 [Ignavibacteriales bacterium]
MRKILLVIILLTPVIFLLGQDNKEIIGELTQNFRAFEYQQVIEISDSLLADKENFSNPDLIEIYRMRGISHYALLDDSKARLSFIEILRIDSSYALDPSFTSPKIITFYGDVKKEYLTSIEGKEEQVIITKHDTIVVREKYRDTTSEYNLKQALIRSLIMPGTGHLYLDSNIKSWMMTFLSVASIGTGIYFMIDANEKERLYLQETNINETAEKYNDFNFSYRMRNLAIISFAALWVYSQLDLLFFIEKENPGIYSYLPKVFVNPGEGILFNYQLRF